MTAILGISAFYHDSAAALIINGKIIGAVQEERFTRKKHDPSFPLNSIKYLLDEAGLILSQIDHIAFYDKPFLKFERLLETYLAKAPFGFKSFRMAIPLWLREKLFLKDLLVKKLTDLDKDIQGNRFLFGEHHLSHAASAFYPSPFNEAIILVLDGVGEWATSTVAIGRGNDIEIIKEIHFPHSIGLLYSAFTYFTGFKVNSGEYKVMGLAPYGTPRFKEFILKNIIDLKPDGSYRLDQSYFNYSTGLTMTNRRFADLFKVPVRKPESEQLSQVHMDLAASIQAVTEEVVLNMTRALSQEYKIPNLCMAGGVALNCVANGKILKERYFKDIWIQPAAGDAGGALGVAEAVWYKELKNKRIPHKKDSMRGSYLGPKYSQLEIKSSLAKCGAVFKTFSEDEMLEMVAHSLSEGKVIGWFQGRMEFGPRALGARSIIADPRSITIQKNLNLKVKFRESFRPFAPSVLREDVSDWFDFNYDNPYMLFVDRVHKDKVREMTEQEKALFGIAKLNVTRSDIPAVTHVDYSARIQTVHKETNPIYHKLISIFKKKTGCPVLVNTSFNVRGEPIVLSPKDAFKCFMGTDIDMLVVGNSILNKDEQDFGLKENYKDRYELD
jgi:carbamoyltransferase